MVPYLSLHQLTIGPRISEVAMEWEAGTHPNLSHNTYCIAILWKSHIVIIYIRPGAIIGTVNTFIGIG